MALSINHVPVADNDKMIFDRTITILCAELFHIILGGNDPNIMDKLIRIDSHFV